MSLALPLLSHLGHLAADTAVDLAGSIGSGLSSATGAAGSPIAQTGPTTAFGSILETAIQKVNQTQVDASQSVQRFLTGQGEELHNVALTSQRASIAFDLGLQLRNRVVAAYQEVMKIQL
jgi:flagellar hook-basal body complex protein FliE